jgi:hypothetical protein
MEAFLYTLDLCLVIYLCRLVRRMDGVKANLPPGGLGPFAYKQDKGKP